MTRHVFGDYSFEVPSDWVDKTLLLFTAPGAEGAPKVSVTRAHRQHAGNLAAYVLLWAEQLIGELSGLALTPPTPLIVGGRQALRTTLRWKNDKGAPMVGAAVHVDVAERDEVLTLGCASGELNEPACLAVFDRLVASSAFGARGLSVPPAPVVQDRPPPVGPPPLAGPEVSLPFVPMPGRRR
jgi:hypothetical protein